MAIDETTRGAFQWTINDLVIETVTCIDVNLYSSEVGELKISHSSYNQNSPGIDDDHDRIYCTVIGLAYTSSIGKR